MTLGEKINLKLLSQNYYMPQVKSIIDIEFPFFTKFFKMTVCYCFFPRFYNWTNQKAGSSILIGRRAKCKQTLSLEIITNFYFLKKLLSVSSGLIRMRDGNLHALKRDPIDPMTPWAIKWVEGNWIWRYAAKKKVHTFTTTTPAIEKSAELEKSLTNSQIRGSNCHLLPLETQWTKLPKFSMTL